MGHLGYCRYFCGQVVVQGPQGQSSLLDVVVVVH